MSRAFRILIVLAGIMAPTAGILGGVPRIRRDAARCFGLNLCCLFIHATAVLATWRWPSAASSVRNRIAAAFGLFVLAAALFLRRSSVFGQYPATACFRWPPRPWHALIASWLVLAVAAAPGRRRGYGSARVSGRGAACNAAPPSRDHLASRWTRIITHHAATDGAHGRRRHPGNARNLTE